MKNKCYECKWRGEVPGSAHSCCKHPSLEIANQDSILKMFAILASVNRVSPIMVDSPELNIKANAHGIEKGWFNFPFNFDPVWLNNCDGFCEKLDK